MRKKLLSLVLALVMMLSMGTVAMAEETPASPVGSYSIADAAASTNTVTMKKAYTILNKGTVSPAETFVFTKLEGKKVNVSVHENVGVDAYDDNGELKEYPITISDAVFDEAVTAADNKSVTEKFITIELPAYDAVGKYTYVFSEVAGSTAGVIYDDKEYRVEVIVTDRAETGTEKQLVATVNVYVGGTTTKSDTISNTYRAGSLSVTKKVSGNMADKNKYFDVTVTFTKLENVTVNEAITYDSVSFGSYDAAGDGADYVGVAVGTNAWEKDTATVTIKLKDNDTVKFNNIPYGVTYDVAEADYTGQNGGYAEAVYTGTGITTSGTTTNPTGIEINSAEQNVNIENNKDVDVDTGINLDSMPYILILAAVAVGGVVIVSKKRKEEF